MENNRLKVWLDDKATNKITSYYNYSCTLWEEIKLNLSNEAIKKLGLYEPPYYSTDIHNATYIDTYSIGDLLSFLNYNYYYNSLSVPDNSSSHPKCIDRRLCILPVPIDVLNSDIRVESKEKNDRTQYRWRIMIGNEIIGEDVELVNALYQAVKCVYLERKLYNIPLSYIYDNNGTSLRRITAYTTDVETIYNNVKDIIGENSMEILGIRHANYRTITLENGKRGDYEQTYDVGDLLNFLHYNYYYNTSTIINDEPLVMQQRLVLKPIPVEIAEHSRKEYDAKNNINDYKWNINIGGEIIGRNVQLIDALIEAINYVYVNSKPKLYINVLNEFSTIEEHEKEFSLSYV